MKLRFFRLLLLLFGLFLVSCNGNLNSKINIDSSFKQIYSSCQMNIDVHLTPVQNSYKFSDVIWLDISNQSNNPISFPVNFNNGLWMFDPEDEKWVELENKANYSTDQKSEVIVEAISGGLSSFRSFVVTPAIYVDSLTTIRVVIFGERIKDGIQTDECVGAYTDITLLPQE